MKTLQAILLKPILKNERTLRYQAAIDEGIDRLRNEWDFDRGLCTAAKVKGVPLPHETISDFWELTAEDRNKVSSPEAVKAYAESMGRSGTAWLAQAAFAWHSPISRHHKDPALLRFFQNGLAFYTGSIRSNGIMAMGAHAGIQADDWNKSGSRYDWSHGWDIDSIVYGMIWCGEALDPALRGRALAQLAKSAQAFLAIGRSGERGNQACVQIRGLYCYAELLGREDCRQAAETYWAELWESVLDSSGQVIENDGPCMHYAYTAFIYAWLTVFLRGCPEEEERCAKALNWFRCRHTESLYPFAGPSSRKYYETLPQTAFDVLPACEHLAEQNPMFQKFADRIFNYHAEGGGKHLQPGPQKILYSGHGANPLIWAILACPGTLAPSAEQEQEWNAPFVEEYRRIRAMGRPGGKNDAGKGFSPIRYAIIRNRYQTHFNATDFLPFAGLQTWAFGNEPPIVHPTLYCPSTTEAWGLDTAQQGTGRAWMDIDHADRGGVAPEHLCMRHADGSVTLLARFGRLYRLMVFTEFSAVQVDCGVTRPRRTRWVLNRVEPAEPQIGDGVVSFANRQGRLYSAAACRPALRDFDPGKWTRAVRALEYEDGAGIAMFAFSDASFAFGKLPDGKDRVIRFSDASGRYRVSVPPELPLHGESPYAPRGIFDLGRLIKIERE